MADVDVTTPAHLAGGAYETTVRKQAEKLKAELIRQTLEDADSWLRSVNDKWTAAHPDQPGNPPIPPVEVASYRDRVKTQDYEWVVPSFERYLAPDPDALNAAIHSCGAMAAMFEGKADTSGGWTGSSSALIRMNDVRADMSWWVGSFKNNFVDHFLRPLQGCLPNQRDLAVYAQDQLKCTKGIYIRYRQSVLKLLDSGIQATQALSSPACSKAEAFKWGTIAMCVVGTVGGAIATGGAALAGAVILDAGGTFLNGLVPEDKEKTKLELGAPTAAEVAQNIMTAMSRLDNDTYEEERRASDAILVLADLVGDSRRNALKAGTDGPFSVPAPSISEATATQITDGGFRPRRA